MDSKNNPIVGRYIPKPIEACLITETNMAAVAEWCDGYIYDKVETSSSDGDGKAEKTISADVGDYIIKTANGSFYKVNGESFKAMYEQIWWEEPE